MATTEPHSRLLSREFLIVAGATACFFAAMGATNPLLPKFVSEELDGSKVVVGVVSAAFAVVALVCRPLTARLGERHGSRLLVIAGCIAGAVGMFGLLLVNSPFGVVAVRVPQGLAQAALMIGSTTLAMDLAPPERRGEAASYILIAFHLGLGLGPLLGEWVLDQSSYDTVWVVLGGVMMLGSAIAVALPHRGPSAAAMAASERSPLLHPSGFMPGIIVCIGMMAGIALSIFAALYAKEVGVAKVAPLFFVMSLTVIVVRVVFSKLPDRIGPARSASIALVASTFGALLLAAWASPIGLYLGTGAISAGGALLMPSLIPIAVHGVDDHRRGSALATFTMFIDVSVVVSGPMFGLIAGSRMGYRGAFTAGAITTAIALGINQRFVAPRVAAWSNESAAQPAG